MGTMKNNTSIDSINIFFYLVGFCVCKLYSQCWWKQWLKQYGGYGSQSTKWIYCEHRFVTCIEKI